MNCNSYKPKNVRRKTSVASDAYDDKKSYFVYYTSKYSYAYFMNILNISIVLDMTTRKINMCCGTAAGLLQQATRRVWLLAEYFIFLPVESNYPSLYCTRVVHIGFYVRHVVRFLIDQKHFYWTLFWCCLRLGSDYLELVKFRFIFDSHCSYGFLKVILKGYNTLVCKMCIIRRYWFPRCFSTCYVI